MAKKAPHEIASNEFFDDFSDGFIENRLTVSQILSVPGVFELVREEFINKIIDEFDADHMGCSKEELT